MSVLKITLNAEKKNEKCTNFVVFFCLNHNFKHAQNIYQSSFGITAPIFAKVDVNGPVSEWLYRYLLESKRFDANSVTPEDMKGIYLAIDPYYYTSSNIKWNFTKFLIGRDGKVIKRLEPEVTPEMLEADILTALGQ